jgi:hypothetical protein
LRCSLGFASSLLDPQCALTLSLILSRTTDAGGLRDREGQRMADESSGPTTKPRNKCSSGRILHFKLASIMQSSISIPGLRQVNPSKPRNLRTGFIRRANGVEAAEPLGLRLITPSRPLLIPTTDCSLQPFEMRLKNFKNRLSSNPHLLMRVHSSLLKCA